MVPPWGFSIGPEIPPKGYFDNKGRSWEAFLTTTCFQDAFWRLPGLILEVPSFDLGAILESGARPRTPQ